MSSRIQEALGAWGQWEINLVPETPGSVRSALDPLAFGVSLLRVYPTQISADQVGVAPGLFTGPVLWQSDLGRTIGGHGPSWFAGTGQWLHDGRNEDGPFSSTTFTYTSGTGTLAAWVGSAVTGTASGLTVGSVSGPATTRAGSIRARSMKTIMDWISVRWAVEWRVNDFLEVEVGTRSTLWPAVAKVPLVTRRGGRDRAVQGLQTTDIALETDLSDWRYRAMVVDGGGSLYLNVSATTFKNPAGANLNWGSVTDDSSTDAVNVQDRADELQSDAVVRRAARLSAQDYDMPSRLSVGQDIYVWDPSAGFYDPNTTIQYQGEQISPVSLRVQGMDWPVQEGMSVWVDRRHVSGSGTDVVELTDYVDWEPATADTKLTIGAPAVLS